MSSMLACLFLLSCAVGPLDARIPARNVCVNCTAHVPPCTPKSTGWSAFLLSSYDTSLVATVDRAKDGDPDLAHCVHEGYQILSEIETFICFWAPYMGCWPVASDGFVNIHHMHKMVCQICARYCNCPDGWVKSRAAINQPGHILTVLPLMLLVTC